MPKSLQKFLFLAGSLLLHTGAIWLIFIFIEPIASWYLTKNPIRGTDIHLSAVYVNYLSKWHEFLRPGGWKYIWFGGDPMFLDYPNLYFLAIIPLVKLFGLIGAVMKFAVLVLVFFGFACYLFYHEISRSRSLALLLTIETIFSVNIYLSLVWAGGIPFWVTQAFFPLVGFLVIKYLNTQKPRFLYLGSLAAGLGVLGHPQGFMIAIIPFVVLILLFYKSKSLGNSFKNIVIFLSLAFLVGLPGLPLDLLYTMFFKFFGIFNIFVSFFHPSVTNGAATGGSFQGNQFLNVFSGTQNIIWQGAFILGIVWLFLVAINWINRKRIRNVLPFAIFLVFYLILLFLFSRGIDLFFGGWYKALWVTPLVFGAVVAIFWGEITTVLREKDFHWKLITAKWLLIIFEIVLLSSIYLLNLPKVSSRVIRAIDESAIPSRTQPDLLSVETAESQRKDLAKKLLPPTIIENPNDKNKRLYVIDATFNLWWNSLFEMPLARGYIDPPITNDERWGLFWLDSALGPSSKNSDSSLLVDWKTSKEVLSQNYKFLLDWNAIYYLAGNWNKVVQNALAKQATSDDLIEKQEQIRFARPEWNPELEGMSPEAQFQLLNYYKVKSELVSPILASNNATAVLLIGDSAAYDTIYRFLGMENLNSQKVVVATKSKFIDDYNLEEFKKFDAIFLYRYDYQNNTKAWDLIRKYLQEGGQVYIDTGSEVKESASGNLPDYFPFSSTLRKDIGRDWNISDVDQKVGSGVDFSHFSPLIYNGGVWNVSYPEGNLIGHTKVILKNKGKVVATETNVGSGKLIWTGFNLPYHVIYHLNLDEANFLSNILSEMIDFSKKNPGEFKYNWISPEKREIDVVDAHSVLFKEEAFPTWRAKTKSGKELTVYRAGPTSPGFIYVPFESTMRSANVELSYHGQLIWWLYWWISLASILIILEMVVFGKSFTTVMPRKVLRRVTRMVSGWWEREE